MPCGTPVAGNTVGGSVGVNVFLNINRSHKGLLFRVTGPVLFTYIKPFKRSLGTESSTGWFGSTTVDSGSGVL